MPGKHLNHGRTWSSSELQALRRLAAQNMPTGMLVERMQRSEEAIRAKARAAGISLKASNRPLKASPERQRVSSKREEEPPLSPGVDGLNK